MLMIARRARVRDTIEELFILFLSSLGEGHLRSGFGKATERMRSYKPDEHSSTANVAPLEQFFELVHIGDTIQSMVQVYFEKELVSAGVTVLYSSLPPPPV